MTQPVAPTVAFDAVQRTARPLCHNIVHSCEIDSVVRTEIKRKSAHRQTLDSGAAQLGCLWSMLMSVGSPIMRSIKSFRSQSLLDEPDKLCAVLESGECHDTSVRAFDIEKREFLYA